MAHNTLTPHELKELIDNKETLQIVDPLTEEHFDRQHIEGAQNICVYEIAFTDNAREQLDSSKQTIVYGFNDSFEAAELACEKLVEAGFGKVSLLKGGLEAWTANGYSTESAESSPTKPDGTFTADTGKSVLRWVGRNLFNQHDGTITIQSAAVTMEDGKPVSGSLVLDMNGIQCDDIEDSKMKKTLIGHLSNSDFFLTSEYPTAGFELDTVRPIEGATYGKPNYTLSGAITLRGTTRPLETDALVGWNSDEISVQGQFDIDRTDFGSKYGSGRFYEALGQHLVNDLISISYQLKLPR